MFDVFPPVFVFVLGAILLPLLPKGLLRGLVTLIVPIISAWLIWNAPEGMHASPQARRSARVDEVERGIGRRADQFTIRDLVRSTHRPSCLNAFGVSAAGQVALSSWRDQAVELAASVSPSTRSRRSHGNTRMVVNSLTSCGCPWRRLCSLKRRQCLHRRTSLHASRLRSAPASSRIGARPAPSWPDAPRPRP